MDALEALHNRTSFSRLGSPAPQGEVLNNIQRAAMRAADHGRLRPWRFLIVEGDGRDALGELFVRAKGEISDIEQTRLLRKPLRAPMIMVAIAKQIEHPKVPAIEQVISTGAAVQNMLNAAYAQGVGAIWRTGGLCYDTTVEEGLGLTDGEKIVGFLYLGTPQHTASTQIDNDPSSYFTMWPS